MSFLALGLAALMGAVLGLLGGGGSLLAVPILVYAAGVAPLQATGGGLVIVGLAAFFGAFGYARRQLLPWPVLSWFALPSLTAVYLSRGLLLPALPDPLFATFSLGRALMLLFAALMLLAALRLWRPVGESGRAGKKRLLGFGFIVGSLTGLIGAGGGFLIVPALRIGARLPMPQAVAGSLALIALNCAFGVTLSAWQHTLPGAGVLLPFVLSTLIGMGLGLKLAPRIAPHQLQKAFAGLLLLVAVVIFVRESWA